MNEFRKLNLIMMVVCLLTTEVSFTLKSTVNGGSNPLPIEETETPVDIEENEEQMSSPIPTIEVIEEKNDILSNEVEYQILLNGNSVKKTGDFSTVFSVLYGDSLQLSLENYNGNQVEFLYLSGDQEITDNSNWIRWEDSPPTNLGNYYLGYSVVDKETVLYNVDGSFGFQIKKALLSQPENCLWKQGSLASWDAVTTAVSGTSLAPEVLDHYLVILYKDGKEVYRQTTKENSIDFTDILFDQKQGDYSFTVQAITNKSENYENSVVSSCAENSKVVSIAVQKDDGIETVLNEGADVLIVGNPDNSSTFVQAEVKANREFEQWSANQAGVQIELTKEAKNRAKIEVATTYQGESEIIIKAQTTDKISPIIDSFSGLKDDKYGFLYATAHDIGSKISAYIFTTKSTIQELEEADWIKVNGETSSFEMEITAPGNYYFYVQDDFGNISQSNQSIQATKVVLHNYSDGINLAEKDVYFVSDIPLNLPTPQRWGYDFMGWYDNEGFTGDIYTQVTKQQPNSPIHLYAQWMREELVFSKQPENIDIIYDGLTHVLNVEIDSYGEFKYQWYRDDEKIEGATSDSYSIKNVNDNGNYYVEVSGKVDDSVVTAKSNLATVNMKKATLNLSIESPSITYAQPAPEYGGKLTGFVNGETEETAGVVKGTYLCAYNPLDSENAKVAKYPIMAEGFSAMNYDIQIIPGNLIVNAKDVADPQSAVTVELEQTEYIYQGTAITPTVFVKENGVAIPEDQYDIIFQENVMVGTAKAEIRFKGNYKGIRNLEFTIQRSSYQSEVALSNWTYGDLAPIPYLTNNPENGEVTYFYKKQMSDGSWQTIPTFPNDAGIYKVSAEIKETANYQSFTTLETQFSILARTIVITSPSQEWVYDGNIHVNTNYTVEGNFVGTDGLQSVEVNGAIQHNGTVENSIQYTLTSSTNSNNYIIQCNPGVLTVTSQKLAIPANLMWSETEFGTAEWIAVTKEDITVRYHVELIRETENGMAEVVEQVTIGETKYDFANSIKEDSMKQSEPGSYYLTIKAIPDTGDNLLDYTESDKSLPSSLLHTMRLLFQGDQGIQRIAVNGAEIPSITLIEGETIIVEATLNNGYNFDKVIWNSENQFIKISEQKEITKIAIASMDSAQSAVLYAHSNDDKPIIGSFSAEAINEHSEVVFTLNASDTKQVTHWAITMNNQEPTVWNKLETNEANIEVSQHVQKEGTYYAWIKDEAENIVSSKYPINIYRISFSNNGGIGEMASLLKVENTTITLPANKFNKEGYSFVHWVGTSGIYSNQGNYASNANDTLVASWTNQQHSYQVEYYFMDTDGNYPLVPNQTKTLSALHGTEISTDSTSLQLEMTGMKLDSNKASSIILQEENQILKVYYERNQYFITYSWQEPSGAMKTERQAYYFAEQVNLLKLDNKEGYDFAGWFYSELGKLPETMPNRDITATGNYKAKEANYYVHYYSANLDGLTYTKIDDLTEIYSSEHGQTVHMSSKDIQSVEGYSFSGMTVTRGAAGGNNADNLVQSVDDSASAIEKDSLNINVYYRRNTYTLTLNVWKGDREVANPIYQHNWQIVYGSELKPQDYINYEQDKWGENASLEGYELIDYVDWSTAEAPSTMPAGNVTISRDFALTTVATYEVEVYYENNEAAFEKIASLNYYGNINEEVTIGDSDDFTINYQSFKDVLDYFESYDFDAGNILNVVSGKIPGPTDGSLVLKVYFKRRSTNTTITYYYNDGTGDKKIGYVTKEGSWEEEYDINPLAFFDGQGLLNSEQYVSSGLIIDGVNAENYDFRKNNSVVSYSGYYHLNNINRWPNKQFKTSQDLEKAAESKSIFGQANNYINVYYNKVEVKDLKNYKVQLVYKPANLKMSNDTKSYPLIWTKDGIDFEVWIANKADIFESTANYPEDNNYPGSNLLNGTYTYNNLKQEYEEIQIGDSTYYLNQTEKRIYIADENNMFFSGKLASYNFLNDAENKSKIGYEVVEQYLADYKKNHSNPENLETYDERAMGAYIVNNGFTSLAPDGKEVYTYTFTFEYEDVYTVTYNLAGNLCTNHKYTKNQLVPIECTNEGFQKREGYKVVWYQDSGYKQLATPFNIQQNTIIFGRYEKETVSYQVNLSYQLPETLILGNLSVDYITDKNRNLIPYLMTQEKTESMNFVDGAGNAITEVVKIKEYYLADTLVLVQKTIPVLSFSEISLDYQANQKDGFLYDSSNEINSLLGYVQSNLQSLTACYKRKETTLNLVLNNSTQNKVENRNLRVGQKVTLNSPMKEGYVFANWNWEIWNSPTQQEDGKWESWLPAPEGNSFIAPERAIRAIAQWTPEEYTKMVTHYFQRKDQTYDKVLLSQIKSSSFSETKTITYEGQEVSMTQYFQDEQKSILLGVQLTVNNSFFYYTQVQEISGKYVLNPSDIIAIETELTAKSEDVLVVKDYVMQEDFYSMYDYSFSVYQDKYKVNTLGKDDSFQYSYSMDLNYYYARSRDNVIEAVAKATDGKSTGTTLIGSGQYWYGEDITLKASISSGFQFLGWYKASDVLENYDSTSSKPLQDYVLKSDLSPYECLSSSLHLNVHVISSDAYIAVVNAVQTETPTVVLTGKLKYEYGYESATDNLLQANVDLGSSQTLAVVGYQWYEGDKKLAGETASTYLLPEGKDVGTYAYHCVVSVERKDNGRGVELTSNVVQVQVVPAKMLIEVKNVSSVYDGTDKKITVSLNSSQQLEGVTIYYSETPLNEDNYTTGKTTNLTFKDVLVDQSGNTLDRTVYVYVHNESDNYIDYQGQGTVSIYPATLSLKTLKAFSRTYDGTVGLAGDVLTTGTEKYKLAHGNYYQVQGIVAQDLLKNYILDFDVFFNDAHVSKASALTLSNLALIDSTGKINHNYIFKEGYAPTLSAYITPINLTVQWSNTEFNYDGVAHKPSAVASEQIALVVQGDQINAGTYKAYASLQKSDKYETSDYQINNSSQSFVIHQANLQVKPYATQKTYNGQSQTLTQFDVQSLAAGQTYTATTDASYKDTGTYTVNAIGIKVYQNGIEVTDNYKINYGSAELTIVPKEVTVTGITAVNKVYDGTTQVQLNGDSAIFSGKLANDSLSVSSLVGAFDNANAGNNHEVILQEMILSGSDSKNYILNREGSQLTTTADITKAQLLVETKSTNVVYGGDVHYESIFTGFILSDNEDVITGDVSYLLSVGGDNKFSYEKGKTTVGTYTIHNNIDTLEAVNYTFKSKGDSALVVDKRKVAVEPKSQALVTKTYDGTIDAQVNQEQFEFVSVPNQIDSGLFGQDKIVLSFTASYNKALVNEANSVTLTDLSIDNENYELATINFELPGKIVKASLKVSVKNIAMKYGQINPIFETTILGFQHGEDETSLSGILSFDCNYDPNKSDLRNVGEYIVTPSGYMSDNYEISYTAGILTIEPAELVVKPDDKEMTYGTLAAMPIYTGNISGFQYDDTIDVVSGNPVYQCTANLTSPTGSYFISASMADLSASNYTFKGKTGVLTIKHNSLIVSNIKILDKEYDGTGEVKANQIDTSNVMYEGIQPSDVVNQGIQVTATYRTSGVENDKLVDLQIQLNEYLNKRYTLNSASQLETTSSIKKKKLTIVASNKTIFYGSKIPTYQVTYSGFVNGESEKDLQDALILTGDYQENSAVGIYQITPSGLTSLNYEIEFGEGTLTVQQAILPTPAPLWNQENPGLVEWKAVTGIGDVNVVGYRIELRKVGDNNVLHSYQTINTELNYNLLEIIREQGAGNYQVQVSALVPNDQTNVKQSVAGKTTSLSAAEVTVQFANDSTSVEGKGDQISIQGKTSYVVIAGEKAIPLQATLKNNTGYKVKNWTSSTTNVNTSEIVQIDNQVNAKLNVLNSLGNNNAITVTLALQATPATLNLNENVNDSSVFYNYTIDEAPKLSVVANVENDNIDNTNYDYTYQWHFKRGPISEVVIAGANSADYIMPTGFSVADNYRYRCSVTATRKDNGESITKFSDAITIKVEKANFTSSVRLSSWVYGQLRNVPSVSYNPENAEVTYKYSTENTDTSAWSTEIPTDVGQYYVKAYIASSLNYSSYQTEAISFEIKKNKLDTPQGLVMNPTQLTPYGIAKWEAVKNVAENQGNQSASAIEISYEVILYFKDTVQGTWQKIETISTNLTEYNFSEKIKKEGIYGFSVKAISDNINNCDNSEESLPGGITHIQSLIQGTPETYTKVYDGESVVLKVENPLAGVSYQWLVDNKVIENATQEKYSVTFVEQSGTYSCQIIKDGEISYTNSLQIEISPKTITVTTQGSKKVYDGSFLSESTYTVDGLVITDQLSGNLNSKIVNVGQTKNSMTGIVIRYGTENDAKIVYSEVDSSIINNYKIQRDEGMLEIVSKSLGNIDSWADSITVSKPNSEMYDGKAHTPNFVITDSGHVQNGFQLIRNKDYTVAYSQNISTGMAIITITGKDNYEGVIQQTFEITQRPITIKSKDAKKDYDGKQLSTTGVDKLMVTSANTLAIDDELDSVIFTGKQIDAGSSQNTYRDVVIKNKNGDVVTNNYHLTLDYGELMVDPIFDTILLSMDEKTYDGQVVNNPTIERYGTGELAITYYAKDVDGNYALINDPVINAGTYYVKVQEKAQGNYKETESDYLAFTIKQRSLVLTPNNKESVYLQTLEPLDYQIEGEILSTDDLNIQIQTEATNGSEVKEYPITLTWNHNQNYSVQLNQGIYTILPAELSYTVQNDEAIYDGNKHFINVNVNTLTNYKIFYANEELNKDNYLTKGSEQNLEYINAGDYVVYYYLIAPNYKPVSGFAKVCLEKKQQIISAQDIIETYDGLEHSVVAYTDGDGQISYVGNNQILSGDYTVQILVSEGTNYKSASSSAKLKINQRNIVIQPRDATKIYDELPLKATLWNIIDSTLATNDTISSIEYIGSQTERGNSKSQISSVRIENEHQEDVTSSYNIIKNEGNLTVEQATGTLKVQKLEDTIYDKTAISNPAILNQSGSGNVEYSYYQRIGETDWKLLNERPSQAGKYKLIATLSETNNYSKAIDQYEWTIFPEVVEFKVKDVSSLFGQPLVELDYNIQKGVLYLGDDLEVKLSTDAKANSPVGVYPITLSYKQNSNYDVRIIPGNYTIEDASIEYEALKYEGNYDGENHGIQLILPDGVETYYSDQVLTEDNYQTVGNKEPVTYTNVGEYEIYFYLTKQNFISTGGSQKVIIHQSTPVINAESLTVDYDGKVHEIKATTNSDGELKISENYQRSTVGKNDVIITIEETRNFKAASKQVTLIIEPRKIQFIAGSAEKQEDGTQLVNSSYTIAGNGLAEGDAVRIISISGQQIEPGESVNQIHDAEIENQAGDDVTVNYQITYQHGTLKVTAKPRGDNSDITLPLPTVSPEVEEPYKPNASEQPNSSGEELEESNSNLENLPSRSIEDSQKFTYGKGSITITINPSSSSTKKIFGKFPDAKEVVEAVCSEEDLEMIRQGNSIEIRLTTILNPESLTEQQMLNMQEKIKVWENKNFKLSYYLDLVLEKKINNQDWEKVNSLYQSITIVLDIPEEYRVQDANYSLLGISQDEAILYEDLDNHAETITIKTDETPTFALLYTEKLNGGISIFNCLIELILLSITVYLMSKKKRSYLGFGLMSIIGAVLLSSFSTFEQFILFDETSLWFGTLLVITLIFTFIKDKIKKV